MSIMFDDSKIILVGGGGHALSLLEAFPDNCSAYGYFDISPVATMPIPYLGSDIKAPQYIGEGYSMHIAFVYAGLPLMEKRRKLISLYENFGATFSSIIATTAIITRHSIIGKGTAILNGAIINRAIIGDHSIVNSGAIVEHDCHIGSNTFIAPGVVIGGGTIIGDNCFIGLGSRLKNGIIVAPGVTIGMGATVTGNLTNPGIYNGTPLRYHPMPKF